MDVAYINPFILGIREVFNSMMHMPLGVGHPRLRERGERSYKLYPISVVIGLSGAVSGLLVMSLAEAVALAVANALAGTEAKSLDADCMDALMETANMVAGAAKGKLPAGQVNITVPTLLQTADVVYPDSMPMITLPFDAAVGRFLFEIALRQR